MLQFIIHPDSKAKLLSTTKDSFIFEDGSSLPVHNNIPILFSNLSLFSAEDILNSKKTTQDKEQSDNSKIKNYIRRKLLPSLCNDFNINERYKKLATLIPEGGSVLVIGTGEKSVYYKSIFSTCHVTTSDVHNEYSPDIIFDGHYIPFEDNCFDLVLAAQVLEHTINPFKFSNELQRVVKIGGLLQIEAPQNYPYHAEPYDFFRFTYTGLRSLFTQCSVVKSEITEGNASMVAVSISTYLINIFKSKLLRSFFLLITRLTLGWMKYLDKMQSSINRRTISMPKGYAFTFKKESVERKPIELLNEFYSLKP